jgi:hypothetical protein
MLISSTPPNNKSLLETLSLDLERSITNYETGLTDEGPPTEALLRFRRGIVLAKANEGGTEPFERDLENLELRYRNAAIHRAISKNEIHAKKRAQLFATDKLNQDSGTNKTVLGRADLLAQNNEATNSLVRTRALLVREVNRAVQTSEVLKESSEMLRDVGGEYNNYGHVVKKSSKLITNMQRRDATDKMLLYIGLGFFLLVVLYILKRRLLPLFSPIAYLVDLIFTSFFKDRSGELVETGTTTTTTTTISTTPNSIVNVSQDHHVKGEL